MKLIVIVPDNAVYKDDICYLKLDLSNCGIPSNVRVLRFDTVSQTGWIEFHEDSNGIVPPNEDITILPFWANSCQALWDEVHAAISQADVVTDQQLLNNVKAKAKGLLAASDWAELPSVVDTSITPHLLNAQEYVNYRVALRSIMLNPTLDSVFPDLPVAQWSS